ncbi:MULTISPECIES: protein kinase [unclassified Adlercreutzia]|uniref:protein kinase domain-containing protein n=1 Tax=unclassified Adlercreutzia TaxID=2636013 RepID=UPI0013EABCDB|nr:MULTISPECIES: protein kinase [unclassified Adlercreutzia]
MSDKTRIENATAGKTRRETELTRRETGKTSASKTRRLLLPKEVSSRYEYLYDLPASGGEADVALLKDKETKQLLFFKFYRAGISPDPMAMLLLRSADPKHVVRLIDFHDEDDGTWEIQEYCQLGSIQDWASSQEGRLAKETLVDVLKEMASALEYLHGLGSGIAHRDLKPANVLVRSDDPLDLVLADFGLAKSQQTFSHLTTMAKGTWHYSAPEVHFKVSTPKSDWFSLGAMLYELYTGTKLFSMADGTEVSEDDARARCLAGNYSTTSIDDPRWKLLIDGLLVWEKDNRWGAREVGEWLSGGSPAVQEGKRAYTRRQTTAHYSPIWSPDVASSPIELATLLRNNWKSAANCLAGRPDQKLIDFLEEFPGCQKAVRIIEAGDNPEVKMVKLQAILDPSGPILFRGYDLNRNGLNDIVSLAHSGDNEAMAHLIDIKNHRILKAYSEVTGSKSAARADYLLDEWEKQGRALIAKLPQRQAEIGRVALREALPDMFVAAFEEE